MRRRTNCVKTKLLCLSVLAGVILYSCQTDVFDEIETSEVSNSFSVSDAKNWFETTGQSTVALRSAGGESLTPVLNWNVAETSDNTAWEVVELPWEYENAVQIFALREVWQHAVATNTVPENVIRLVVMQHRKTGKTYGVKMMVAPTLDYLLRYGENLSDNKLLDRDSQLSGIVLFYTLDDLFVNGWGYQNGEIVAEFVSKRETTAEDVNAPTTRSDGGRDGWNFDFLINQNNSFHDDGFGDGGRWWEPPLPPSTNPPLNTPSHPTLPPISPLPPGPPTTPPTSPPTGPPLLSLPPGGDWSTFTPVSPGNGSGSGNTGPMPNQSLLEDEDLTRISRRLFNFINVADIPRVERMIEDMLKNCLGQALYDKLVGRGDNFTFEFWNSNYSTIHPVNRKMSLVRDGFSTFYLFHELVHGYQLRMYDWYNPDRTGLIPGSQWDRNFINIEIETHLLYYYYISSQPNGMNEHWKRVYREQDMYMEIAELAEHFDSNGRIKNVATFERYLIDFVVPAFIRGHTNERRPNPQFNDKMSYDTMFATMRDLWTASADCRSKLPKN
ncbi:MAG: hypothetical protein LBI15_01025 [Dysgonamonadaceae bacterium]|nr:hypothetical protein [Dysgonamonadaceae bacterium]